MYNRDHHPLLKKEKKGKEKRHQEQSLHAVTSRGASASQSFFCSVCGHMRNFLVNVRDGGLEILSRRAFLTRRSRRQPFSENVTDGIKALIIYIYLMNYEEHLKKEINNLQENVYLIQFYVYLIHI